MVPNSSDLSYNIIREISTPMPSSLYFLNISHNTLQKNWIQTPLTVSVLDVSYNEGGMAWMPNVLWGVYLPKLSRLVFRGNQLDSLELSYNNFPMTPLAYLDLSDNPNLILSVDSAVWNRRDSLVLTVKQTLYEKIVHICDAKHGMVYSMLLYAVQYLPEGNAIYDTPYNRADIVTNVCFLGYTPPPYIYTTSYGDPSKAIFMQIILTVGLFSIGVLVAYFVGRRYIKRRNERTPFRRGTFCSYNASGYDNPSTEEAPPTAYSLPPPTPRQH
ncbi:hypothetical protein Ae201684_016341 [Aphanomyces euteiches]|uniref:Leucine-rich repeat-containing N-terminal plant-type domain-containing protein n=1 Tax=Aphanomyces euteiches TaxID=100861 RepID=A0A6G0WD20_9STRA|nr:hypothetical protein Ae201684_016341 [Aphanomyces euteiches]KAH9153823.1 hypothetical protein AeRB84_003989 [Aphanomyces euteiches]